ncbi:hypothetical protein PIIN_08350 [Serendipita indica DSM 11827]|uniref:Uncharacterized protein n=1 Tax=Serendipita indica (strain DSM 11827) TaxID=1109443 RepID=G4TSV5_SERID|nr:hypothetical protein PIIN_08350 [Serendipita indica DSM 11827]
MSSARVKSPVFAAPLHPKPLSVHMDCRTADPLIRQWIDSAKMIVKVGLADWFQGMRYCAIGMTRFGIVGVLEYEFHVEIQYMNLFSNKFNLRPADLGRLNGNWQTTLVVEAYPGAPGRPRVAIDARCVNNLRKLTDQLTRPLYFRGKPMNRLWSPYAISNVAQRTIQSPKALLVPCNEYRMVFVSEKEHGTLPHRIHRAVYINNASPSICIYDLGPAMSFTARGVLLPVLSAGQHQTKNPLMLDSPVIVSNAVDAMRRTQEKPTEDFSIGV